MNSIKKLLKHLSSICRWIYDFFCQQIVPGLYATWANRVVDANYDITKTKGVSSFIPGFLIDETLEQLTKDFERQLERKKGIEDKAKTSFATISISVTAITFTLANGNINCKTPLAIISIVLLFLSIIYIIMGSIRAMQTINIRAFNVFQTEITDAGADITVASIGTKKEQLERLAIAKFLNDKIITKVANYGYASSILVRNGIILFALYFVFALSQKLQISNTPQVSTTDTLMIIAPHTLKITLSGKEDIKHDSGIEGTGLTGLAQPDTSKKIRPKQLQ